jgi:hypothetical protein
MLDFNSEDEKTAANERRQSANEREKLWVVWTSAAPEPDAIRLQAASLPHRYCQSNVRGCRQTTKGDRLSYAACRASLGWTA